MMITIDYKKSLLEQQPPRDSCTDPLGLEIPYSLEETEDMIDESMRAEEYFRYEINEMLAGRIPIIHKEVDENGTEWVQLTNGALYEFVEQEEYPYCMGKWARRRVEYLENFYGIGLINELNNRGILWAHLEEVDNICKQMEKDDKLRRGVIIELRDNNTYSYNDKTSREKEMLMTDEVGNRIQNTYIVQNPSLLMPDIEPVMPEGAENLNIEFMQQIVVGRGDVERYIFDNYYKEEHKKYKP